MERTVQYPAMNGLQSCSLPFHKFALFVALLPNRILQVSGLNFLRVPRDSFQTGVAQDVDDASARQFVIAGQRFQIDIGRKVVGLAFEVVFPKTKALSKWRHREMDHGLKAASKGFIDVRTQIRRENHYAREVFDPLKKI